jgi:hypothetical protein
LPFCHLTPRSVAAPRTSSACGDVFWFRLWRAPQCPAALRVPRPWPRSLDRFPADGKPGLGVLLRRCPDPVSGSDDCRVGVRQRRIVADLRLRSRPATAGGARASAEDGAHRVHDGAAGAWKPRWQPRRTRNACPVFARLAAASTGLPPGRAWKAASPRARHWLRTAGRAQRRQAGRRCLPRAGADGSPTGSGWAVGARLVTRVWRPWWRPGAASVAHVRRWLGDPSRRRRNRSFREVRRFCKQALK